MKKLILTLFISSQALAGIPNLPAISETTPIPAGHEETDDAAIWVNQSSPAKSLVLGVSKTKLIDGGQAGLGVYDLAGKQIQYFQYDRLNNVDIRGNIAAASNRDKKSITLFSVHAKGVTYLRDIKLPITEEPYGFCLQENNAGKLYGWLPMKSGLLYKVDIANNNFKVIDTRSFLTPEQDAHLISLIIDDVMFEKDLPKDEMRAELKEEISDRFQLEGCVSDDENNFLYLGMENLGVWKVSLKEKLEAKLIFKVQKSKSDPELNDGVTRVTNDIEGITIYKTGKKKGAIIVSVQGLNEYAVLDRQSDKYLGSFTVNLGKDAVTETDGLTVTSQYLGPNFPDGLAVFHDHHNTNDQGVILNGNYKYMDMRHFLRHWPQI